MKKDSKLIKLNIKKFLSNKYTVNNNIISHKYRMESKIDFSTEMVLNLLNPIQPGLFGAPQAWGGFPPPYLTLDWIMILKRNFAQIFLISALSIYNVQNFDDVIIFLMTLSNAQIWRFFF